MATIGQINRRPPPGQLWLEIVTPDGPALGEAVDEITACSVEGQFGVLPGHVPLLASLKTGLLAARKGAVSTSFAIGTGFVEVADDFVVVMTDKFLASEKIDIVATRAKFKELSDKLGEYDGEQGSPEHLQIISQQQWQAAVLELFGDPPQPVVKTFEVLEPPSTLLDEASETTEDSAQTPTENS